MFDRFCPRYILVQYFIYLGTEKEIFFGGQFWEGQFHEVAFQNFQVFELDLIDESIQFRI